MRFDCVVDPMLSGSCRLVEALVLGIPRSPQRKSLLSKVEDHGWGVACSRSFGGSRPRDTCRRDGPKGVQAEKEQLRTQMEQSGVLQHRTDMLTILTWRSTNQAKVLAIVEHLLDEELVFTPKHFAIMMGSLGKRRCWEVACGLLSEMRSRQLEPNRINYNTVLDACARAASWKTSVRLLDEMPQRSANADVISFSSVMTACSRALQWRESLVHFAKLTDAGLHPDRRNFSAAMSACAQGPCWESAGRLLGAMSVWRVQPDIFCYNSLISACGRRHEWARAFDYLLSFDAVSLVPDTVSFNTVMDACVEGQRWEFAVSLFQEIRTRCGPPSEISYHTFINASAHKSVTANELLSLMEEMRADNIVPTSTTYDHALGACASWEGVIAILGKMRDEMVDPEPTSYVSAIKVLSAAGQHGAAQDVFRAGSLRKDLRE